MVFFLIFSPRAVPKTITVITFEGRFRADSADYGTDYKRRFAVNKRTIITADRSVYSG